MKKILSLVALMAIGSFAFADDNIVIVFDTSGSMGAYMRVAQNTRMKVAQDALVTVLSKVPDTTKIGILTFEGWIYDLQKVDHAKLEQSIRNCRPGGGTPLYEYIKKGGNRLLEERAKQGNVGYYKLLVVTDGAADSDVLNRDGTFGNGDFKPGVLKDIISRGITVDAIGLDMRSDHPLKNQINGNYMKGDDPNTIEKSLKKAVAEVGFNGKDGVTNETFKTISDLPDNFVKDSIKALTEFRNYGLGEQAPVMVVKDGVVISVPFKDVAPSSGWSALTWMLIVGSVLAVGFLFVVILNKG